MYPCESKIFCHGEFLDAVQNARIFEESKEFVDMKIKNGLNEEIILSEFGKLQNPSADEIRSFVESHFDQTGSEFENFEFSMGFCELLFYWKRNKINK